MSKFTFTASFETIAELASFVQTIGGQTSSATSVTVAAVPAKSAPKEKPSKKADKPELTAAPPATPFEHAPASEMESVPSPFKAEPVVEASATPVVNVEALVEEVRSIAGNLQQQGKDQNAIRTLFASIDAKLGLTPGVAVSKRTPAEIQAFVNELRSAASAAPAPSFI